MKLMDMEIKAYLELLASKAPAPGGGSVSALAGAQGCALLAMVCDLTTGKEKYQDYEMLCIEAKEDAKGLMKELIEAVDKDTEAYSKVSEAFKLPKATEEEKAARSQAIRQATVGATEVPFWVMTLGYKGLRVARDLVGQSNPNAASDVGVAALNLNSTIKGAWLNVKINLPGLKNPQLEQEFINKAEEILAKCDKLTEEIYDKVLVSL
ncbi:MAG: cyclodeaminase/cyclohydrolase family protein [Anaerovoracaceae bacterium]